MKMAKKALSLALAVVLVFSLTPALGLQAATRGCDVSKASSGNTLVLVPGTYEYVAASKILKRINQIRKEACTKGYINPNTGAKLKSSDYKAMKWSTALEWTAMLRASEAAVYESHTRPSGKNCFTVTYKGKSYNSAENLAWNYSGIMEGIEQWYDEKGDWVIQNSSAVTGHYTSMINPSYTEVGIGSFVRSTGGWYCIAAEFNGSAGTSSKRVISKNLTTNQRMEVSSSKAKSAALSGSKSVAVGKKKTYKVTRVLSYPGIMGGTNKTTALYNGKVTWTSSNKKVGTITSAGKFTAKKKGTTVLTAKLSSSKKLTKKVTVK